MKTYRTLKLITTLDRRLSRHQRVGEILSDLSTDKELNIRERQNILLSIAENKGICKGLTIALKTAYQEINKG